MSDRTTLLVAMLGVVGVALVAVFRSVRSGQPQQAVALLVPAIIAACGLAIFLYALIAM